ncbi:MAG: peptide-methionine (S)-S-oxide reductase MsrA [Gammaproteobacteria bacterium]
MTDTTHERIILAAGCFWGVQDLFRKQPGIINTRVGYSGGTTPHATYRELKHGKTGHAEAVEVIFDRTKTDLRAILEFFFQIHDPTTIDQQGNDRGNQYRSAIFYANEEQRNIAQETIKEVEASGLWPGKIVTEVAPEGPFWEAEPEHQDYLVHYPNGYTCHFIRADWRLPKREK